MSSSLQMGPTSIMVNGKYIYHVLGSQSLKMSVTVQVSKWLLSVSLHTVDRYQFPDQNQSPDMLSSVDRKMLFLHFVAEVTKSQESEMISQYYTALKICFFSFSGR